MSSDFCSDHSAHQRAIDVHDHRLNSHGRQLDDFSVILQRLTDIEDQNAKRIGQAQQRLDNHSRRIDALEDQPANDAKRVKDAALAAIGGAVGAAIVGGIAISVAQSI